MNKACKRCGRVFEGSDHAWHCPKCKAQVADANCISWHLISPEGKHYEFNNLTQWARENCKLFEFEYSERNVKRIVSGISQIKGAMLGVNTCKTSTYKGWKIVIVYGPNEICTLYQNGMSVNKIHAISNVSAGKIKKILITNGLYKNKLSEKIEVLIQEGKTMEEITSILQVSGNVVNIHTPYSKAVYNYKMSDNALRIKKSRLHEKK